MCARGKCVHSNTSVYILAIPRSLMVNSLGDHEAQHRIGLFEKTEFFLSVLTDTATGSCSARCVDFTLPLAGITIAYVNRCLGMRSATQNSEESSFWDRQQVHFFLFSGCRFGQLSLRQKWMREVLLLQCSSKFCNRFLSVHACCVADLRDQEEDEHTS